MPMKYVVFELKDDQDLGSIVGFLANKTARMAVVDSVPGIFEPVQAPQSVHSSQRLLDTTKEEEDDHHDPVTDTVGEISFAVPRNDLTVKKASAEVPTVNNGASSTAVVNMTIEEQDEIKENMLRLLDNTMGSLGSIESEFVDALETPEQDATQTGRRRKRKNENQNGDYDLYGTRRKARSIEETLNCGLCKSSMTLRASYGRTRLREHVLRHLNLATAKCGICGFLGVLREHIRRHHSMKHAGQSLSCIDLDLTDDFSEQFDKLWKTCFPETKQIAARSNMKKLLEGSFRQDQQDHEDDGDDDTDAPSPKGVPLPVVTPSVSATMEAIMQSLNMELPASMNMPNLDNQIPVPSSVNNSYCSSQSLNMTMNDVKPDVNELKSMMVDDDGDKTLDAADLFQDIEENPV